MPTESSPSPEISKETHLHYLHQALALARLSPPKPSNFRVGCVLVSYPTTTRTRTTRSHPAVNSSSSSGTVISTGYTLELPGNTHAEQCALTKLSLTPSSDDLTAAHLSSSQNVTLYSTLEPCSLRLSGNTPCVQRIISTRDDVTNEADIAKAGAGAGHGGGGGIRKVIFGAKEPGTFVQDSQSCRLLTEAGVAWEYIPDLEEEILKVAMEGHQKQPQQQQQQEAENGGVKDVSAAQSRAEKKTVTNIDDITPEERKRQAAMPRNPKKRMMEAPPLRDG